MPHCYTYYMCNGCSNSGSGYRWHYQMCSADYCERCAPSPSSGAEPSTLQGFVAKGARAEDARKRTAVEADEETRRRAADPTGPTDSDVADRNFKTRRLAKGENTRTPWVRKEFYIRNHSQQSHRHGDTHPHGGVAPHAVWGASSLPFFHRRRCDRAPCSRS